MKKTEITKKRNVPGPTFLLFRREREYEGSVSGGKNNVLQKKKEQKGGKRVGGCQKNAK